MSFATRAQSWDEPRAARRKRLPPVGQFDAVDASELFIVEARIGRTTRGGRVVGRRDALAPASSGARAPPPRRRSPRRNRPRSPRPSPSCGKRRAAGGILAQALAATASSAVGEVERRGRIAALVGDDRDLIARLVETKHRRDEIRAERADRPRRCAQSTLSAQRSATAFRRAWSARRRFDRPGRVVLALGAIECAVEHIISRQMQRGAPIRSAASATWPAPLPLIGARDLLRLGLVDGGIGGGVDHHVRPRGLEPGEPPRGPRAGIRGGQAGRSRTRAPPARSARSPPDPSTR